MKERIEVFKITYKEKFLKKLHALSVLNEPVDYYQALCIDLGGMGKGHSIALK